MSKSVLQKGLSPEEALQRWGDPESLAGMKELEDARDTIVMTPEGQKRHWDYVRHRDAALKHFAILLHSGKLLCSAVTEGQDKRLIISLAIWPLLYIDFDFNSLVGENRRYELAEFFEPAAIPANVDQIPDWVKALPDYQNPEGASQGVISSSAFPVVFAVEGQQLVFNGGITPTEDRRELILTLLSPFKEALEQGSDPDDFPFMEAKQLADTLSIQEQSVRQRISRARSQLAAEFRRRFGVVLDRNAIIENNRWDGYRLNPRIIPAKPFQVLQLH